MAEIVKILIVEYYIADNGVGFDMAYAGELFGTFQRLHDARDFEGAGIGLAIVHRIILKHGGTIRAEAAPGRGRNFLSRCHSPHEMDYSSCLQPMGLKPT